MKSSMPSLAPFVVLVLVLAGCGTTPPVPVQSDPVPSDSSPSTGEASESITLLRVREGFALYDIEPLHGVLELDGTCVVLGGAAVVFDNTASVDAQGRIVTLGATLQLGADIADTLAWGEVPIAGSRLPESDASIHDAAIIGLDDCSPSRYSEFVVIANLDATE